MKKQLYLSIISLFISFQFVSAQTFQKTFSTNDYVVGTYAIQVNDGGYVMVGETGNPNTDQANIFIVKTNVDGDTVWTKIIGGAMNDLGVVIRETSDGYAVLAKSRSFGIGAYDLLLVKLSTTGTIQWSKTYGAPNDDDAYDLRVTGDGGYIIAGEIGSALALIKTNSTGDTTWTKKYLGSNSNAPRSLIITNDGGYTVAGISEDMGTLMSNTFIVRFNASGDTLWTRAFGTTTDDELGYGILQTADGGFVVAGYEYGMGSGADDMYLTKTDANGNMLWSKTIGSSSYEQAVSIAPAADGGFLLVGSPNMLFVAQDIYAAKTDSAGNVLWTQSYTINADETGNSVQPALDGGFVISGTAEGNNYYLIKTDKNGVSGCNETAANYTSPAAATQTLDIGSFIQFNGCFTSAATVPVVGNGHAQNTLCYACVVGLYGLPDTLCANNAPVSLIGSPSGGTFSGAGMTGNSFNPATAGVGMHIITYINNGGSCSGSATDSVYVKACGSGINDMEGNSSLVISPNPSNGNFEIASQEIIADGLIQIFNTLGEKVFEEKIKNRSSAEINAPAISQGIYFVKLSDGKHQFIQKLMIQ